MVLQMILKALNSQSGESTFETGLHRGQRLICDFLAAGPFLASVSIAERNALCGFSLHPLFLASQAQTVA